MELIVGTAGHIDHGKTQLVKALTGTDTDRLPEEKQRGITIDLGFADLKMDDIHFGFVDVPGHERFVKNMLAGASGIDLVLLVIAADEGIMPQTREHFDICRLLRIKRGIVAITKTDLIDSELLELVRLEADELVKGTFLESAPSIAVSAKTGKGLSELKTALLEVGQTVDVRSDELIARLPVDRSFSIKGFGTVVTGTLASGAVMEGEELELLPVGSNVRIRGVQTHGEKVQKSVAGRRTALNLAGVDYSQIERGMLLAEPGVLRPEQIFDAAVEVLADAPRPLRTRQRVRLHVGTAEVLARVAVIGESQELLPGKTGYIQLRLESPIAAILGERFILRSYSPQITVAGGSVLRPAHEKFRRRDAASTTKLLSGLSRATDDKKEILKLLVGDSRDRGISATEIRSITGWKNAVLRRAADELAAEKSILENGGTFIESACFDGLRSRVLEEIDRFHKSDPLAKGMALEMLREKVFKFLRPEIERAVLENLISAGDAVIENDVARLASFSNQLSYGEKKALEFLRSAYSKAGLEVPKLEEVLKNTASETGIASANARKLFQKLLDSGEIIRISEDFYFSSAVIDNLTERLRTFAAKSPDRLIDVPQFKELAGVSRKFAIPLLEYFDQCRVTARRGDKRLVI
jgi:selenocysteine-specific elongation factor